MFHVNFNSTRTSCDVLSKILGLAIVAASCGKSCFFMACSSKEKIHTKHLISRTRFTASVESFRHGLSQQGVWVPFWTPKPLKRTPQDTQKILCGISKNLNLKLIIEFFHLLIIPMTLFYDIMPYFDEFIHVYVWNMSILDLDAQNFYNCQF